MTAAWIKYLQKGDNKHMEIIKYVEKENGINRVGCIFNGLQCCWLLKLHLLNDFV
jgi:hypothetical protein